MTHEYNECKSQGMPPQEDFRYPWFISGEGIDRQVIFADIQRYLGSDATVRAGTGAGSYEGVNGFHIKAYRNLTTEMVKDLRADTERWREEQRQYGDPTSAYVDSDTFNRAGQSGTLMLDSLLEDKLLEDRTTFQYSATVTRGSVDAEAFETLKVAHARSESGGSLTKYTPPSPASESEEAATRSCNTRINRDERAQIMPAASSSHCRRTFSEDTTKANITAGRPATESTHDRDQAVIRSKEYMDDHSKLEKPEAPAREAETEIAIDFADMHVGTGHQSGTHKPSRGCSISHSNGNSTTAPSSVSNLSGQSRDRSISDTVITEPGYLELLEHKSLDSPHDHFDGATHITDSEGEPVPDDSAVARLEQLLVEYECCDSDETESSCGDIDAKDVQSTRARALDRFAVVVKGFGESAETGDVSGQHASGSGDALAPSKMSGLWAVKTHFSLKRREPDDEDEDNGKDRPRKIQKQDNDGNVDTASSAEMIPCIESGCCGKDSCLSKWVRKLACAHDKGVCTRCWEHIPKFQYDEHVQMKQCEDRCVCQHDRSRVDKDQVITPHRPDGQCARNKKVLKECGYLFVCQKFGVEPEPFTWDVENLHDGNKPRRGRNSYLREEIVATSRRIADENKELKVEITGLEKGNEELLKENRKLKTENECLTAHNKELQNIVMAFKEHLEAYMTTPNSLQERVRAHAPNALTPSTPGLSTADSGLPMQEHSKTVQTTVMEIPLEFPVQNVDLTSDFWPSNIGYDVHDGASFNDFSGDGRGLDDLQ